MFYNIRFEEDIFFFIFENKFNASKMNYLKECVEKEKILVTLKHGLAFNQFQTTDPSDVSMTDTHWAFDIKHLAIIVKA